MVQFKTILKNSIKLVIPLTIGGFILKKKFKKSFNYISQSMSLQVWENVCQNSRYNQKYQTIFQNLTNEYLQTCANTDHTFQELMENTYSALNEDGDFNQGRIIVLFLFLEYSFKHSNISYCYYTLKKHDLQLKFLEHYN